MTNSVAGLRRSFKALPKAKVSPKKGHGHCSVVCCPSDPLQFSESWQNHYIGEVRSANWWVAPKTAMPEASIGQQKWSNCYPQQSLIACCTTNVPKVEWIGLQSFALFTMFTYISPTDYYFFKHFNNLLQEKPFHSQQDAENAFQEFIKSWSMDFYATGINKHFSLANMCWL